MLASYRGLRLDYAQVASFDTLCTTLLWVAECEGVLEYIGQHEPAHYLVLVNGSPRLLQPSEVPGYVLALFDAQGIDPAPIAYRTGLVAPDQE